MIHHGDQEIKKDDNIYHREGSEHEETGESRELFDPRQFEVVQIDQTKNCPEESLRGFPEAEKKERRTVERKFHPFIASWLAGVTVILFRPARIILHN